jgi:hypothetical protein
MTYEIVLKGFHATDHLVKWINAKSLEAVDEFLDRNGLRQYLHGPPENLCCIYGEGGGGLM